jgi:hypothetical protein
MFDRENERALKRKRFKQSTFLVTTPKSPITRTFSNPFKSPALFLVSAENGFAVLEIAFTIRVKAIKRRKKSLGIIGVAITFPRPDFHEIAFARIRTHLYDTMTVGYVNNGIKLKRVTLRPHLSAPSDLRPSTHKHTRSKTFKIFNSSPKPISGGSRLEDD